MDVPSIVLSPGERLLWSGRPQRIGPVGLEWLRPVFGSVLVAASAAVVPLVFPGYPFAFVVVVVAGGLAGFWWPVLARPWVLGRAVYTVTDRRVVVADRVSGRVRRQAELGTVPPAVTWLGRDGLGTLDFGPPDLVVDVAGYSVGWHRERTAIRLVAVPEPDRIHDLVVAAQEAP
ncbi:hypothetical protein [Amycolatopsis sp. cg9]|uniref:hypothetical protein n=1 Tax=Amycolatopsis sp. cg9 TaxID=3238801 RepID=UPI00352556A8